MDKKKAYEAPQLTVVTIKTERGYAGSGMFNAFTLWGLTDAFQVESYEQHEDWTSEGGFWE